MLKYFSTSFLLKLVSLKTNVSENILCDAPYNVLIVGEVSYYPDGLLGTPLHPGGHVKLDKNEITTFNFNFTTWSNSMLTWLMARTLAPFFA